MTTTDIDGYVYPSNQTSHAHGYLLPSVLNILGSHFNQSEQAKRVFDLGCGNGSVANVLSGKGYSVCGVDPSVEGIKVANASFPELQLFDGSAYDDLSSKYSAFPAVISLEVVEHVYAPRDYAKTLFSLVEPGDIAVVSTPYHGYLKNLALAVTGKLDQHFTVLWDHGHIKFWSMRTLSTLLREVGFDEITFHRVGRISTFAKSMIAVAKRAARS